jgi:6-phosphogluconolactonase (cycloisomerase 2 family)
LGQQSSRPLLLLMMGAFLAAVRTGAQTPQHQYVYGAAPVTTTTSQIAAYVKNGQSGALTSASGSPFADQQVGVAMAVDALGRFLFLINPGTDTISMFQINQANGALTEVPASPFSTGPTENPNLAPALPSCLAIEKSGQFLYVGYRLGNLLGQGAIDEYSIDAANLQLVPLTAQPTTDIPSSPVGMLSDAKGLHLYVGLGLNAGTGTQDGGTNVYSIDPITGILVLTGAAGNAQPGGKSIAIDPLGRFFFDSWSLAVSGIDSALISPADGTATTGISTVPLSADEIPVAMLVDGSGKFLYVQQGSAAVVYSINQTTGALSVSPSPLSVLAFRPDSAAADPLGPYLYSLQADGVYAFLIDSQSGALSEIPGSPFTNATGSGGVLAISGAPVQALSGPVAALFPASENFGGVNVGQSSSSQLATLTDTGEQSLSVNSITVTGSNAADFTATPTCAVPTVLSPNSTCTISIVFSPTAAGLRQASVTVSDNAPGNPQAIPLTGTGVAPLPAVALTPASMTFASTAQGATSLAQTITVTSAGVVTLHISSVVLSGVNPGDFTLMGNTCIGAFAPNASCTISVTFSPLGAGQRTANVSIADDAPNSPQSVQLTGTGQAAPTGKPAVTLSPNSVAFGTITQGSSAGPQSVTLTNSGSGPLHISSIVLNGTNSGAVSMNNGCTAPAYAAGGSCTIGVSIVPLAAGLQSSTITIVDDAPDSPQTLPISANAIPAFTISPAAAGGTSVTITAGQTASFMLQITPGPGFAGTVSFACASVPTAAACSAPSVALNGGGAVSYVVSVSTTGASAGLIPWKLRMPRVFPLEMISLLALCALLFSLRSTFRSQHHGFAQAKFIAACAVVILLAVVGISGCGGDSVNAADPQSVPAPQPAVTPTPQGTFTLSLTPAARTASGTLLAPMSPVQLTLTVQ